MIGFLKYVSHDAERDKPVNLHRRILDSDLGVDYGFLTRLRVQPAPNTDDLDVAKTGTTETQTVQSLAQRLPPFARAGNGLPTQEFRLALVDYEAQTRK